MDPFDLRLWSKFKAAGGKTSDPAIVDQIAIDSRRIDSPNSLFVALPGSISDGHLFVANSGARYAVVKKGWEPTEPLPNTTLLHVDDPLKALQQIAHSYRKQLKTKIIAITGSYGKTMVKDLLHAIVSRTKVAVASPESFNSQIGVALSLLTINQDHEIAIIEAGISKKSEMDVLAKIIAPDYGVLTHIGKKHLATMGDKKTIAGEKMKLMIQAPVGSWTLLPQDPLIMPYLDKLGSTHYFWNESNLLLPHAMSIPAAQTSSMPYRVSFPDGNEYIGQTTFGFYYFLDLINISVKAAWLAGIPSEAICSALKDYTPEPMRTELWKSPIGTLFINDTYCSDPQSVDQALKYFDQAPSHSRKVFVFGGMRGKKQHLEIDYRRIGQAITRSKVQLLLLVGSHKFNSLVEQVEKHSPQTEISFCANYNDAINQMRARIKDDDVVLIKGEKKESLDTITEAFNDSICNNQCIVNLAAVQANIATIRAKLPKGDRILVMVKALAYGTDEVRMAKFLATCGVDILGVSYVEEGVVLKRAGVTQDIFVINAAIYEAAKVVKWELQIGVNDKELIKAVASEASRQNKVIKVHLHVNTGMGRFGCRPEEALELSKLILDCPSLALEGIMTHFACADNPADDPFTLQQASCMENIIQTVEAQGIKIPWKHASNSSAVMRFEFPQFNMARIGLAVYGLYPSEAAKKCMDLRLAVSLVSRIVGINLCKNGESISYGRSYTVTRDQQRIAVLPIGYFDGLHRNYSGKGHVIIRGHKAPMVGKICMDFMMVDITDIPMANIGDAVLIFGEDEYGHYLSPEDLAMQGDSIVYELITCLGPRIQRVFVYEEASHMR